MYSQGRSDTEVEHNIDVGRLSLNPNTKVNIVRMPMFYNFSKKRPIVSTRDQKTGTKLDPNSED